MSFRLLEPVRNTVASERNPHRDGWYLRTITRQGGMNSGRWAVVLHADGTESETPPGNLVSLGVSRDYCQECPAQMPQVGGGKCAVDCNLRSRIEKLEKVVAFFADESNWHSPSEGFALQYDPKPSPVQAQGRQLAIAALEEGE